MAMAWAVDVWRLAPSHGLLTRWRSSHGTPPGDQLRKGHGLLTEWRSCRGTPPPASRQTTRSRSPPSTDCSASGEVVVVPRPQRLDKRHVVDLLHPRIAQRVAKLSWYPAPSVSTNDT